MDAWVGTVQNQSVAVQVRIDVEVQQGARLQGSGTAFGGVFAMTGRYAPPTVYFKLTSELDTLTFVGEMFSVNLVSGNMAFDRSGGSGGGRVVLARR